MDPVQKLWWYEGWLHDRELELETSRSQAILIGSFYNPEAANKMIKQENPDFISSDEDFEKSTQMIVESRNMQEAIDQKKERLMNSKHRRKRRQVVE